jgi:hypothetical protein
MQASLGNRLLRRFTPRFTTHLRKLASLNTDRCNRCNSDFYHSADLELLRSVKQLFSTLVYWHLARLVVEPMDNDPQRNQT